MKLPKPIVAGTSPTPSLNGQHAAAGALLDAAARFVASHDPHRGDAPLVRVSRAAPCPPCGKTDWCSRSADGAIAICMRVESPRPTKNGGWLHILRDDPHHRPRVERRRQPPPPDLRSAIERAQHQTTDDELRAHADALGLSAAGLLPLRRLGAHLPRYDADDLLRIAPRDAESAGKLRAQVRSLAREAATWLCVPMYARGRLVGVRLRHRSGHPKRALCGGRAGLFLPNGLRPALDTLAIVEGPTDCAALLSVGVEAIGRPDCTGAVDETVRLALVSKPLRVAVICDRDRPGIRGAVPLAKQLAAVVGDVRCVLPPRGTKDARAWITTGATAADILAAVEGGRRV